MSNGHWYDVSDEPYSCSIRMFLEEASHVVWLEPHQVGCDVELRARAHWRNSQSPAAA